MKISIVVYTSSCARVSGHWFVRACVGACNACVQALWSHSTLSSANYPVPAANTRHRATPNRETFTWTQKAAKQSSKLMENRTKIKKKYRLRHLGAVLGGLGRILGPKGVPVLKKNKKIFRISPTMGATLGTFSLILKCF